MITFKLNNQRYSFPTRWEDVTFQQYVNLLHTSSIADLIHIFTGISRETLQESEIKNLEQINLALSFLSTPPKFERSRMVGPYALPQDVTIQSTGQFEDLRALLLKLPKDPLAEPEITADLYLSACAIYCQKLKDGKYDPNKVPEPKEELKQYSCMEVLGTGSFFLFKPLPLSRPTTNPFPKFFQRLKNMIVALPGYQKTLVLLQRFFGSVVK